MENMNKMIIGSTAIKHWFEDFSREPKDLDYITDIEITKYEDLSVEYLYNPVLLKYKTGLYATPTQLLSLKISHLKWDINWSKHMYDIQFLLSKNVKPDMNLVNELVLFWKSYHKKKTKKSDLSLNDTDFFKSELNGKDNMSHDDLHEILNDYPMYKRILRNDGTVDVCEKKFNDLSFEDKSMVIQEEVMVMAYERFPDLHHKHAYNKMLKKFFLMHCPEFMEMFIINNFYTLMKPKFNFIKRINEHINQINK
jgi:hypothetical protein